MSNLESCSHESHHIDRRDFDDREGEFSHTFEVFGEKFEAPDLEIGDPITFRMEIKYYNNKGKEIKNPKEEEKKTLERRIQVYTKDKSGNEVNISSQDLKEYLMKYGGVKERSNGILRTDNGGHLLLGIDEHNKSDFVEFYMQREEVFEPVQHEEIVEFSKGYHLRENLLVNPVLEESIATSLSQMREAYQEFTQKTQRKIFSNWDITNYNHQYTYSIVKDQDGDGASRARLLNGDTRFEFTLKGDYLAFYDKFTIAHEMAHEGDGYTDFLTGYNERRYQEESGAYRRFHRLNTKRKPIDQNLLFNEDRNEHDRFSFELYADSRAILIETRKRAKNIVLNNQNVPHLNEWIKFYNTGKITLNIVKQLRQESKNSDELIFQRFFKYDTNDKNVVKILNWDPSEKKYQKFQNSHLTWTQESTIDNGKGELSEENTLPIENTSAFIEELIQDTENNDPNVQKMLEYIRQYFSEDIFDPSNNPEIKHHQEKIKKECSQFQETSPQDKTSDYKKRLIYSTLMSILYINAKKGKISPTEYNNIRLQLKSERLIIRAKANEIFEREYRILQKAYKGEINDDEYRNKYPEIRDKKIIFSLEYERLKYEKNLNILTQQKEHNLISEQEYETELLDLKLYYEEICKIIQESGGNVELQEKRLFDLQENKALKLYEIKLERNLYTQSNYLSFLSNILHMQYGTLKESDMQYFDTAFEKGFITQNIRTMFENKIIRELLYTKIANIKQDYQNKMQEDWTQYRTITTRLNEIDGLDSITPEIQKEKNKLLKQKDEINKKYQGDIRLQYSFGANNLPEMIEIEQQLGKIKDPDLSEEEQKIYDIIYKRR